MRPTVCVLVLIVIACTGAVAVAAGQADASVTILPLGDSITRGGGDASSPYPSDRYHLGNLLRNGGYDVDFVGSTTDPAFTAFVFDRDHDGYSGTASWRTTWTGSSHAPPRRSSCSASARTTSSSRCR